MDSECPPDYRCEDGRCIDNNEIIWTFGKCCESVVPFQWWLDRPGPNSMMGDCDKGGALWTAPPEIGGTCIDNKVCSDAYRPFDRLFPDRSCGGDNPVSYDGGGPLGIVTNWMSACNAHVYEEGNGPNNQGDHGKCRLAPLCQDAVNAMAAAGHYSKISCGLDPIVSPQ